MRWMMVGRSIFPVYKYPRTRPTHFHFLDKKRKIKKIKIKTAAEQHQRICLKVSIPANSNISLVLLIFKLEAWSFPIKHRRDLRREKWGEAKLK